MLNKKIRNGALALALAGFGGVALAAVILNPDGTGFVGKGDVQFTFDWNNAMLQKKAEFVEFKAVSEVVTEQSWVCTNSNNETTQERARTTTTTIAGLVDSIARERNQITGFNLLGYSDAPDETSSTDGQPLNSCPSGPWTLTTPAGDPVVVSSSNSLRVSPDSGESWVDLDEKPAP